jgi:hypothetical protein
MVVADHVLESTSGYLSRRLRDNSRLHCTSDETATWPRTTIEIVQRSSVSRASRSSGASSIPSNPVTTA